MVESGATGDKVVRNHIYGVSREDKPVDPGHTRELIRKFYAERVLGQFVRSS